MKYVPEFDGVRALSALAVLAFHSKVPFLMGGFIGVDIFFVLSGYLITSILMSELERTGQIQIGRFYLFRFFRLMPPLVFLLVLYFFSSTFLWPEYKFHLRDIFVVFTYLGDYGYALFHVPSMLKHTWSLSVEEHFYLIWPFVILGLARLHSRKTMLLSLLLLYVASIWWRIFAFSLGQSWDMIYFRFDTRISGLVLGAILAVWLARPVSIRVPPILAILAVSFIGFRMVNTWWGDPLALQLDIILIEIAAAVVILAIVQKSNALRWLGNRFLAYLGKLSYGIYLFHYPLTYYLRSSYEWEITFFGALLVSVLLSALSYHLLEIHFRNWKGKREDRSTSVDVGVGVGVGGKF